ncbi:Rpn family recombination-promoting nuclease/putative transposase [Magnetococcales bacterium HHB-1]
MGDHDYGYKELFSFQEMVRDLLKGFIPSDWLKQLDLSTLEKARDRFNTDDLREREDDIIWRLRWGSEWIYLFVILEFQSTVDHFMTVRINGYVSLLYQDLIKSGYIKRGDQLPPVLPIVLYNGAARWTASTTLSEQLYPPPAGLECFQPQIQYLLIDEQRYDKQELSKMRNLVAALFRLEQSRTPEDIREVLVELIEWLGIPELFRLRRAFTVWLRRVLLPRRLKGIEGKNIPEISDLHEVNTMLAETVQEWVKPWKDEGRQEGLQEGIQEGIQKGLQEGELEGKAKFLRHLLQEKFGTLSSQTFEKLSHATVQQLDLWFDRALRAGSLDDVFKEQNRH